MRKEDLKKIREVYQSITKLENDIQTSFGLNLNEAVMLCSLREKETLTSGELATELCLSNSNASKVIASVEKKGLVRRKVSKEDKRQMCFTLTAKGNRFMEEVNCEEIFLPEVLMDFIEEEK